MRGRCLQRHATLTVKALLPSAAPTWMRDKECQNYIMRGGGGGEVIEKTTLAVERRALHWLQEIARFSIVWGLSLLFIRSASCWKYPSSYHKKNRARG